MKLIPPRVPRGPRPQYDRAREAAIENAQRPYIKLVCGHVTILEVDLLYSHWRPNRNKSFCENCSKWVLREKPYKAPPLPDTPLF